MDKTQLSKTLGITRRTLDRWIRSGLPVIDAGQRGKKPAFDLPSVLNWLEVTGTGFSHVDLVRLRTENAMGTPDESGPDMPDDANFFEKFQKARAESEAERAKILRFEREKMEGSLVDAAAVRRAAFTVGRQSMQSVMALRFRLDPLLAGESDPARRAVIWEAELRALCDGMARGRENAIISVMTEH